MPQYRTLKSMVSNWVKDIAQQDNPFADKQIQHLMRYITSPSALLYDPAIQKLLGIGRNFISVYQRYLMKRFRIFQALFQIFLTLTP